jgi:hypothetical protein
LPVRRHLPHTAGVTDIPTRGGSSAPDDDAVDAFARWFDERSDELLALPTRDAVDVIHARLQDVADGLGVEVGDEQAGRELVISAGRDRELFPLVDRLCDRLRRPSWLVHALKPPRGWDFTTTVGDVDIPAAELFFDPLESASRPGELGLRLFAPEPLVDAVRDAAWWMLETGLGEREAAGLAHVEAAPLTASEDPIPLRRLGEYLIWRRTRRAEP